MGAVAAALREKGFEVSGSDDNVYPPMSTFLASRGIPIMAGFRASNIPEDANWIVVGNAISRGNPEVEAVLDRRLRYSSLPETLKEFFLRDRHNLVVTGTHGKTTTTSLLTWIFEHAGYNPGYMIGGIPLDLGSGARLTDSKYFIIEGDEYDTAFFDKRSKFVHYLPELVIVNNIEFDHADIFRDLEAVQTSFRQLLQVVPSNGMILLNADDPNCTAVASRCQTPIVEVGFSENAGNRIRNVSYGPHRSEFTLFDTPFALPMGGEFNVRNAAMAISAAHFYGVPMQAISEAVSTFRGVKRRQEIRGIVRGVTVLDDFGHHPTAIRQTLRSLRQTQAKGRIWAVFEPRSNSTRRAVFQQSLPEALSLADGVFLAQVARLDQLPPDQRLDPAKVIADIAATGTPAYYEPTAEDIVSRIVPLLQPDDSVVIFSNGGFDNIHERLLEALRASEERSNDPKRFPVS